MVNAPPTRGPAVEASERAIMFKVRIIGRLVGGPRIGTSEKTVTRRPDDPRPAIARPAIRAGELGAAPQIAEPTRNRNTAVLSIQRME